MDFSRSGKTNFHRKGGMDKFNHYLYFNDDYEGKMEVQRHKDEFLYRKISRVKDYADNDKD